MEIRNMTNDELEARLSAIAEELDAPEADLTALETEVRDIKQELETRKADAAKRAELRSAVANGKGDTKREIKEAKNTMTTEEIRSSAAYINAYANFVKTGDDTECRAMLTENASGQVMVPVLVDDIVRHAWENDSILSRVRKTTFKGNLKIGFEISATGAVVHTEGTDAPAEETLTLGIVTMIPANIKKWIRLSDEVVAMGGEAFLRYVYEELTHQIVKKLADMIVDDIAKTPETSSATAPGAAKITEAPSLVAIPNAFAHLSDEATNNVVIMNKLTYAKFVAAQVAGNFAADPFMGLDVLFNNRLPAYDTASGGDVYAIVGDLNGEQVNYPEGEGIVIKYDDLTESEKDLVKIVGRQYVAHAVTAPFRFTKLAKPE